MPEEKAEKEQDHLSHDHSPEKRRQFFKSFEAKSLKSRSFLTQVADDLTEAFSSTTFLFLNAIFFAAWIILNAELIPGLPAFDPFPYGLLTMAVSLEAIFLSIFVLVSQNRSAYISSLREEVHLRVDLIAETEITKMLEILAEMRSKMGIKEHDPELEEMLRRIDTNYIERSILEQINRAKPSLAQELSSKVPEAIKSSFHNGESKKE
jgi:uncharacterized membrane protein